MRTSVAQCGLEDRQESSRPDPKHATEAKVKRLFPGQAIDTPASMGAHQTYCRPHHPLYRPPQPHNRCFWATKKSRTTMGPGRDLTILTPSSLRGVRSPLIRTPPPSSYSAIPRSRTLQKRTPMYDSVRRVRRVRTSQNNLWYNTRERRRHKRTQQHAPHATNAPLAATQLSHKSPPCKSPPRARARP